MNSASCVVSPGEACNTDGMIHIHNDRTAHRVEWRMREKSEMRRKKAGLNGFHRLRGGETEKERDRRVKGLR